MNSTLKRLGIMMIIFISALMLVSCGGKKDASAPEQGETASATQQDTSTITGTIDEIKDFMFVIEADDGNPYAFPYDSGDKPEGLADVAVGDSVKITYTGELTVVDNFTGEIISIEKIK